MKALQMAPKRGDIVWAGLSPTVGHEQAGLRPVLILSPIEYNQASGLCVVVPLTSKRKRLPFEVTLKLEGKDSVVLVDQLRTISWQHRVKGVTGKASGLVMKDVEAKIRLLLQV